MLIYPTQGKYAAEIRYSHGPTYHAIYDISYGECATNEPFCVRWPTPFFTQRLICHITNLIVILNFLYMVAQSPYGIYYKSIISARASQLMRLSYGYWYSKLMLTLCMYVSGNVYILFKCTLEIKLVLAIHVCTAFYMCLTIGTSTVYSRSHYFHSGHC